MPISISVSHTHTNKQASPLLRAKQLEEMRFVPEAEIQTEAEEAGQRHFSFSFFLLSANFSPSLYLCFTDSEVFLIKFLKHSHGTSLIWHTELKFMCEGFVH